MAKKPRPRADRRAAERSLKQTVRDREKLVALEPGGSPERPIPLETPALVEPTARSTPCHQCGGELGFDDHAVEQSLRVVRAACRRCHAPRTLWFRITPRAVH